MFRLVCVMLVISITSLVRAEGGMYPEDNSGAVLGAKYLLSDPKYNCRPYMYFQKPGDSYNYFTLTVCEGYGNTTTTYLLTNNSADVVYWSGLGTRKYNGVYKTSDDTTYAKGPYLESIMFHESNGPLVTKVNPGETVLPPYGSDKLHNSGTSQPTYLPLTSFILYKPYVTITMVFTGDEIKFSEVFVPVLAQEGS